MSREAWVEWLLGLAKYLEVQGYDHRAVARHLGRLKSLALSFDERGLGPESLETPGALEEYFAEYAAEFQALRGRAPGGGSYSQIRSAVNHLLDYARQSGRLKVPTPPPLPECVPGFLEFCQVHRGLSRSTVSGYEKLLTDLTVFANRRGEDELVQLPLDLLDEFVAHYCQGKSRTTVGSGLAGLRGFLRWLFLMGQELEDRSCLIEGPRLYREMRLPRHLDDDQLEEVLSGVNRATPGGKQEWAVLLLVSVLGLRIGEVAKLLLDDLDLAAGRLAVRRSKTGTVTVMPLDIEVNGALEAYLWVRPETHHREIFVTWRAPIRPYARGGSLSRLVQKHMRRLENPPSYGPHTLRHTLARRLRQGGTPLVVIRRVLGHATSDSTGRYLRIATDELTEVAANYAELL